MKVMKMKSRALAILMSLAMVFTMMTMIGGAVYADDTILLGDGTAENPYKISSYNDLKEFANIVNGTNGVTQNTAACAILTADIECTDETWTPIGTEANPYTGIFDGCGHVIKKLSNKDCEAARHQGLFGHIGNDGTVQNIGLEDSYIQGRINVGGVAGYNNKGTISNCYNTGTINGNQYVGGVAGLNQGEIRSCYNSGSIIADNGVVGGVTGNTEGERGEIINCYNTGDVRGNVNYVGGVTGSIDNLGKATNCYNTGDVKGSEVVGGVSGAVGNSYYKPGTMTNCYNTGDVSGGGNFVGGVAGLLKLGTISNCYYDKVYCTDIKAVGEKDDTDNVTGLTTEEMTGTGALSNMVFVYGTGETPPWMEKANDENARYYPHLKGFNFDEEGKQMDPADIQTYEWPTKTDAVVETPAFSLATGDFGPKQSIAISCTTDDATIYYTTDGSDPTTSSNKYTKPITISDTITIKAFAVKEGAVDSGVATATYTHVHKYGAWTNFDADQHQKVCEHDETHVIKENHTWDSGEETEKATEKQEGIMTYTCTTEGCNATRTETIPKLEPAVSGTSPAKMKAGKKSMTIAWNKVEGAAGYDIFFAKCNHGKKEKKCKKIKTIKGNQTFKWTKTGLKKGVAFKAYVKAFVYKDGKKTYVSKSPMYHAFTGNGSKNYTNAKSVTLKNVKKGKLTLTKGKTFKIKAKVNKINKKKKLVSKKHAPTLRYMTSDKKVATVTKKGKITAKGKGTCVIYVYAHNGVSKSIKVTVK